MTSKDLWYKPKLIEVALPLEDINRESAREKSIRHGHPSTLHLWWARRPLAACRAVLFAQLVDDPSAHPELFPTEEDQKAERDRLHGIISRLVIWENIHDEKLLKEAHDEIVKSCRRDAALNSRPLRRGRLYPPGGSAPRTRSTRIRPQPRRCPYQQGTHRDPAEMGQPSPRFPRRRRRTAVLARRDRPRRGRTPLRQVDARRGRERIGHLYPKVQVSGVDATVIAWIWARTVTCPNPACAGTMPLVRSFWLGKKKGKERYVIPVLDGKRVRFQIGGPDGVPREGTVDRTGAVCLICGTPVPLSYIREEGKAGRMSAQLMAIAAEGTRQRYYIAPTDEHEKVADISAPRRGTGSGASRTGPRFPRPGYGMRT